MPNVRIIAKGQRGDSLTKLKVNFAPEQSTVPSLYPETESVYLRRATEGTGELMELVGGSVAWNQLVQNGNFASSSGWSARQSSISIADNVATVVPTSAGTERGLQMNGTNVDNAVVGNKYFLAVDFRTNVATNLKLGFMGSMAVTVVVPSVNTWVRCSAIWVSTNFTPKMNLTAYTTASVGTSAVLEYQNAVAVDLTAMFGSTIADYVYSLEQATAGSGIAWLKSYGFFTEDYYAYDAGSLQSVEATSHVTKDADDNVISTTAFGSVTLRGIPKLDSNNNLYYDGDTYEWDGTVTRYFGERAYQAGDESLTDAITDGTNTVYKLTTPTTESADPFTAVQTVEDGGTEEFETTNNVPVGVVGRFANAVPMEGVDSFTVTADDGTTHTYPVTLSEEIYRGYVDMLTGDAVSDMASIAEYNGETISTPWLSSLDVYSLGATPTRGAQVVYPITPEEVTATITGDPTELGNVASVSSTEGTVDWSEMAPLDGKCIVRVVS